MSQMNMTPSEQQSMEIAASALAMEALYKDGSSKGVWTRDINKNMAESGVREGADAEVPLP